jgi:hypothetical protein
MKVVGECLGVGSVFEDRLPSFRWRAGGRDEEITTGFGDCKVGRCWIDVEDGGREGV